MNKGENFTCQATHESKEISRTWSECDGQPKFKPEIQVVKPSLESVLRDTEVTATCVVQTTYNTKLSWLVDGHEKPGQHNTTIPGRTVSSLVLPTEEWKTVQKIKCKAEHPCITTVEKEINITEPLTTTPTVVIRRRLEDTKNGDNVELECIARDLPSGEFAVLFKANAKDIDIQYMSLPKGGTFSAHTTVSKSGQIKDQRFTCHVQQSHSRVWKSSPTGTLFGDSSVELLLVPRANEDTSTTQRLRCIATGFNPQIQWIPTRGNNLKVTMGADGSKTVSSEISVSQDEWNKGDRFTCKVTDQGQSKPVERHTSVCEGEPKFKPEIQVVKSSLESILKHSPVKATCVVQTTYNTKLSWLVDGHEKPGQHNTTIPGRTVSSLVLPTEEWKTVQKIKCKAEHPCLTTVEKEINITEPLTTTPTVVIRRRLEDTKNGDNVELECIARDLPSGEFAVLFKANAKDVDIQYMSLPKGGTFSAHTTVSKSGQIKDQRFTCHVQQSHSRVWKSSPTGTLFGDPSVELLLVPRANEDTSTTQRLRCIATGFNPQIQWIPTRGNNLKVTMGADGSKTVNSEISVSQDEWNKGDRFTCKVTDQGHSKPVERHTSVCEGESKYKPEIQMAKPSLESVLKLKKVNATCVVQTRYNTKISWLVDGKEKAGQPDTTIPGRKISRLVFPTKEWKDVQKIKCKAEHPCITPVEKEIDITVHRSPTVRVFPPSDNDLSGIHQTTLLCMIDGFHPADIFVYWELNGNQLKNTHFTNSPVSMRVWGDYSMHSILKLPASRENGTYSCVVWHESSEKPTISSIENIYASVNIHHPSVELLKGRDELVCLVYDYSPSAINLTWIINSNKQNGIRNTSAAKGPDGKFSIKSHLKVQESKWAPGATYTCHVEHITGIITRNISKTEFLEATVYYDENKSETNPLDQAEETWNMACAFIILFIIALLYGCSMTLIKVKIE